MTYLKKFFLSLGFIVAVSSLVFSSSARTQVFGDLMLDNFNHAPLGDLDPDTYTNTAPWTSVSQHSTWPDGNFFSDGERQASVEAVAQIRTDSANSFGRGTTNQILALEEAAGISFNFSMPSGVQVATFSLDTIVTGYAHDPDNPDFTFTNRLTNRFFTDDGTAINLGLQRVNDETYRARNEEDRFDVGGLYHFDLVVNNSAETITYDAPGGTADLDPGMSALWANGELSSVYAFGRTADLPPGDFTTFTMETFSNNPWSAEFDNVALTEGAYVIPEPSTVALLMGVAALGGALFIRRRRSRA